MKAASPPDNQPVELLDRDKNKSRTFDFFDMVYEVRCQMDHAYEDLDANHPNVDNHVLLSWNLREYFARPGWTLPMLLHVGDRITMNAYALIETLAGHLNGFVLCIEVPMQMAEIEERKKSIDMSQRPPVPITIGRVGSTLPSFFDALEKAGIVKRQSLTSEQA